MGEIQATGAFQPRTKPALEQVTDLWTRARLYQRTLLSLLRASHDSELDMEMSKATTDEIARGWLGGPFTPAQLDKMVAASARKYRQFRSQTIARTEALRATNFGVQDAWRQLIEAGGAPEALVRRQWVVAKDERLCDVCAPVPGLNPKRGVPFAQPFATPVGPLMMPPAHPNCRCTVFIRRFEPEQLS